MDKGPQRASSQDRESSFPSKLPIPAIVRRNTLRLAGATAVFSVAFITFLSLAPPLMVSLTGSLALAGAPQSINTFVRMVLSYPMGRLMDRYGRCLPLAAALLLAGGAAFLMFYAVVTRSLGIFLAALALVSMGYGVGHQIRVAATDMFPPDRKGEGVGYLTSGSVVGALAGPPIMGTAYALSRTMDVAPEVGSWLVETRGRSTTGAMDAGGTRIASKLSIACGWPSSSTVKSSRVRPSTGRPALSVTTTSTLTISTPVGNVVCGEGEGDDWGRALAPAAAARASATASARPVR